MAIYDAFISYSHAKDKPIAAALQSVVQALGKPWYKRRALRLFRDDTRVLSHFRLLVGRVMIPDPPGPRDRAGRNALG